MSDKVKFTLLVGLAVLAALLPWSAWPRLARMPRDLQLAREDASRRPAITPSSAPGPVERDLLAAARGHAREWLIADAADPAYDPKRWAAACDAGDAFACARVGSLLTHPLQEPEQGLALLRRACDAGVAEGCFGAARVLQSRSVPFHDPAAAHAMFRAACASSARLPQACSRAERADLVAAAEAHETRPDLRFATLQRGCALADRASCERLAAELRGGEFGMDQALAAYYDERARRADRVRGPESEPPEIAQARQRLEESLLDRVAWRRIDWAVAGSLYEHRLLARHDRLLREIEACAAREPLAACETRIPMRAHAIDPEGVNRGVRLEAAGRSCAMACPARAAGREAQLASVSCLCRCLLEPGLSDAPVEVARACIDDAGSGRWQPMPGRVRESSWFSPGGY